MHSTSLMGLLLILSASPAQLPDLFIAQPGQILRASDLNADGDAFDAGELTSYATGFSPALGELVLRNGSFFLLDVTARSIIEVRDLNGDGDALDFNETRPFAQVVAIQPVGLASLGTALISADQGAAGTIHAFADQNADGDALDADETRLVADGLTAPRAAARRPDGAILVTQDSTAVPVRILRDRNADGDFLDFAENLSYGEQFAFGTDVTVAGDFLSFLAVPSAGLILALRDVTRDGDALDMAEVISHAELSGARLLTADGPNIYVATSGASASIHRIVDLNGDGDALDFAEVLAVATGFNSPTGLAISLSEAPPCIAGDANSSGGVDTADVPPFVDALLHGAPGSMCRYDINGDGGLDAKDLRGFISLLAP